MTEPLYKRIIQDLEDKIRKDMKPNQKLPSERQLLDQYHVSRNTIRLALADLEERGIIYRLHGKGTFVSTTYLSQTNLASMYSFTEQMRQMGHKPSTDNRTFKLVDPEKEVIDQLNLAKGEKVYKLVRVRYADGIPMMYGETYLPENMFPDLKLSDLNKDTLYGVLKNKYNERSVLAFEDVQAVSLNKEESEILKTKLGAPSLKIYRRTINENNLPIEFTKTLARGDKFIYRSRQYNNN